MDKDIVAGSLPPDDLARSKSVLQSSRGISEGVKTEFDSGRFQKRELPESPSRMTGALRDGKILKMLKVEEGDVKQADLEVSCGRADANAGMLIQALNSWPSSQAIVAKAKESLNERKKHGRVADSCVTEIDKVSSVVYALVDISPWPDKKIPSLVSLFSALDA